MQNVALKNLAIPKVSIAELKMMVDTSQPVNCFILSYRYSFLLPPSPLFGLIYRSYKIRLLQIEDASSFIASKKSKKQRFICEP